jgi:type IV pilus assembly protein PilO
MEEFLNKVAKAPASAKVGVGAVGVMLLLALHYFLVYSDQESDLERLRNELSDAETTLVQKENIAKHLTKYQREVERLEQEVNEASTSLPAQKEISDLLRSISDLAKKAGLEIKQFAPGSETKREFYAEVPLSMTLVGTYHEVLSFFYSISKLTRIVNVSNVVMDKPSIKEKKVIVQTECDATTFRLLSEDELAKQAALAKEDEKKKALAAKKKPSGEEGE